MSEESEQRDYEAMNAKTALDLNKAQQEIERLTKENKAIIWTIGGYKTIAATLRADNERLRAVYDALMDANVEFIGTRADKLNAAIAAVKT